MRRLALLLILALFAAPLNAEQVRTAYMAIRYDLDATTATACAALGQNGDPYGAAIPGNARVTTSGSSTTVTAVTAGEYPFLGMAAKDVVWFNVGGTLYPRCILTYTTADSVVVDTALDLSAAAAGYAFTWKRHACGTGASDGWVSIEGLRDVMVGLQFGRVVDDGNGIILRLEGSKYTPDGYNHITQLWPTDKVVSDVATTQTFNGTGITDNLWIAVPVYVDRVRVLVEFHTADDGNDLTTNSENLTFWVAGMSEGR